jgi:signal transduction histidine kinase
VAVLIARAHVIPYTGVVNNAHPNRVGIVTEVSPERRTRDTQIKALFQRLVTVQEDERRRISRDLHDHLGQQLTALRMNLEVFRLQCDLDPARLKQLERTQQLAEDLDKSIDFLTWQLRPAALEHLGLAAAITELVDKWSERFSVEARFDTSGLDGVRLHRDIEENLYRIAQEALNNVAKHAKPTRVNVMLEHRDGCVTLVVEDNGCGFDLGSSAPPQNEACHLGLIGMRERAALIGGELKVETAPDRGTSVHVRVP